MAEVKPEFRDGKAVVVAGIAARYAPATKAAIPALWGRFVPLMRTIPGKLSFETYGVCFNLDGQGGFEYLCGLPIGEDTALPEGLRSVAIPAGRYAVFSHGTDLSTLAETWRGIFAWLGNPGYRMPEPYFEWYSADFCAESGTGALEIWIPVAG